MHDSSYFIKHQSQFYLGQYNKSHLPTSKLSKAKNNHIWQLQSLQGDSKLAATREIYKLEEGDYTIWVVVSPKLFKYSQDLNNRLV